MSKPVNFTRGQFFVAVHRLAGWFERQRRVLPWRDDPSLYRVWISEIMLQQTQVITVIPYFERFIAAFPDVQALATAPESEVMRLWAGLGYYSRARNLHRAAKVISVQGFPQTREGWLELPGVGQYTAGAVLSIALDQPEAILDANVERVVSRIRALSDKDRLWRYSRAFVKSAYRRGIRPSIANQALMELGAMICTPKSPKCAICPLFDLCRACDTGEAEKYPIKRKAKEWISVEEELHCVMDSDGRVLLRERHAGEWRAGLWDLLETRETTHLRGNADLIPLGSVKTRHVVTRHKISRTTHVWKAESPQPVQADQVSRWISISDPEVAVGSALKRTLKTIRETFPEAAR